VSHGNSVLLVSVESRRLDYNQMRRARDNFRYTLFLSAHQRGSVIASIKAGSPRFTTSSARRMAGPRSFGFVIGPSA
jgi:hypothetical protein